MTTKLLVILNYPVSDLLNKGEYPAGYYNPGDVFDEVHLLLTVNDNVDVEKMQFTGGRGQVFVHSIPAPSMKRSLGWQPFLLKGWVAHCVEFVRELSPNLIRVHNSFIQGYLASELKRILGIPYVMSLHGAFDRDDLGTWMQKFIHVFRKKLERISIKNTDAVIAVYSPIIRYAREYGAKNIHLIYNAVAANTTPRKTNYSLSTPPKLITINRLTREKNPENIIRAIQDIDCQYLIVGDGFMYPHLQQVAHESGVEHKVEFIKSIPNEQLLSLLAGCDLLVSHCDLWGISKSLIESALLGLPIVINQHPIENIGDLEGGWVTLCENTPESYRTVIKKLLADDELRGQLGEKAYIHASENFDPTRLKEKTAAIYRELMR